MIKIVCRVLVKSRNASYWVSSLVSDLWHSFVFTSVHDNLHFYKHDKFQQSNIIKYNNTTSTLRTAELAVTGVKKAILPGIMASLAAGCRNLIEMAISCLNFIFLWSTSDVDFWTSFSYHKNSYIWQSCDSLKITWSASKTNADSLNLNLYD